MRTVHLAFCTTEVHLSPSESMDRSWQNWHGASWLQRYVVMALCNSESHTWERIGVLCVWVCVSSHCRKGSASGSKNKLGEWCRGWLSVFTLAQIHVGGKLRVGDQERLRCWGSKCAVQFWVWESAPGSFCGLWRPWTTQECLQGLHGAPGRRRHPLRTSSPVARLVAD